MGTKTTALTSLSTSTGDDLLYIVNDPAGVPASHKHTVTALFTGRTHTGLLTLDQNSNAVTLSIDAESTTANVVDIVSPTTTTGNVIDIADADALTTGSILNLVSNSADTGTRNLMFLKNTNSLSTGTTCLEIEQNAAQRAVLIDQKADDAAVEINSNSTTANVLSISTSDSTTGTVVSISSANSLTTGRVLYVHSNSADTGTRNVAFIHNDNVLSTGATCLSVRQDAAQRALFIDHNADASSIRVTSAATAASVIDLSGVLTTTGDIIDCGSQNSLTTGRLIYAHSNSADTSTRILSFIHNDNALATGATVLTLQQDAAQRALFIDQNGNDASIEIDSEATTANVFDISDPKTTTGRVFDINTCDALTTGQAMRVQSNSADTGTRKMVLMRNSNALATGATVLTIEQQAAKRALLIDQDGSDLALEIDQDTNSASDIYAVKIASDNAGAGNPGGIDMSSFAVDEPLLKVTADAITTPGTLSQQFAIDVGGTTYYVYGYTTGT